jgi:Tfp pilus assembly protein PilX
LNFTPFTKIARFAASNHEVLKTMICQTKQIAISNSAAGDWQGGMPRGPIANQNGSVMILALLVMTVMMVIAISSSDTVVTENFIMRNVGIYRQNLNLVDAALMEGLQRFMHLADNDPDNFDPDISNTDWINNRNTPWTTAVWYQTGFADQQLNNNNSMDVTTNNLAVLNARGEDANGVLRCAVVGWEPVTFSTGGSTSLVVGTGTAIWRQGRILAEYVSEDAGGNDNGFGMLRMELGVKRPW